MFCPYRMPRMESIDLKKSVLRLVVFLKLNHSAVVPQIRSDSFEKIKLLHRSSEGCELLVDLFSRSFLLFQLDCSPDFLSAEGLHC